MSEQSDSDIVNGEVQHYALFSGGHDSLVSTHYCMENGHTDAVLHLDTGTGIPENEQYVIDVCEQFGWPLQIKSPRKTLKEFAKEWGFPGPAAHSQVYRYFKSHTLQRVAAYRDEKPHFWTGVRKDESERRMRTVTGEEQVDVTDRWIWHAPIAEWSEQDCQNYLADHDLPKNPVVANIHRSGECFCGSYATRDEELIDLAANYPDHYEWLRDVEQEVQDEIGTDKDYCWWGHGGMSSHDLRGLIAEHDEAQMVLCSDCGPGIDRDYAAVTDGGSE